MANPARTKVVHALEAFCTAIKGDAPTVILESLLDAAIELTDAECGYIVSCSSAGVWETRVARTAGKKRPTEEKFSKTFAQKLLEKDKPIVSIGPEHEAVRGSKSILCTGKSALGAPLEGSPAAIMLYEWKRPEPFGEGDMRLLAPFASIAGRFLSLLVENASLKRHLADARRGEDPSFPRLIGSSEPMAQLRNIIIRVAPSDETVLITGESGTGKEAVAHTIHERGLRQKQEFVAQNVAAMPEHLLESLLFGHKVGAFTGASSDQDGLFFRAHRGTLFLDEIGDMPPAVQTKVLRVLQEREVTPLGSSKSLKVDVRIIAATHRNLEALVRSGHFREDLYYRLNVIPVRTPPLRERRGDIPVLAEHFLRAVAKRTRQPPKRLSRDALEVLENYPWPGNVRELENTISRALVLGNDPIQPLDFGLPATPPPLVPLSSPAPPTAPLSLSEMRDAFAREQIVAALRASNGNVAAAAKLLTTSPPTLYRHIARLGIPHRPNGSQL